VVAATSFEELFDNSMRLVHERIMPDQARTSERRAAVLAGR
jgi:hypothetical protein